MKRNLSLVIALVIVFGFSLIPPSYAADQQTVELKIVTFLPRTENRMVIFQDLLKLIEEKSNGAIKCKYLGGPEVIPPMQQGENVRMGNVQMAVLPGAFFKGLVPVAPMISLSQYDVTQERARGLWDKLAEIFEPSDLYPLGRFMPHNDPAYYIGFRKVKPESVDDIKGLKIGFASVIIKEWVEKVGATFVQVPLQDGYTALEKGVVDAYSGTVGDHLNYAYCEAEDYIVDQPVYGNNGLIIMNLKTWKGLPQNLRDAINQALLEWEPQSMKRQRDLEADQKQQIIAKNKAKFIKLPPAEQAKYVQAVYDAEWPVWEKKQPKWSKVLRPILSK